MKKIELLITATVIVAATIIPKNFVNDKNMEFHFDQKDRSIKDDSVGMIF